MMKLPYPKPLNRQASLVSNEGLRGNFIFSSPTQFTIRCIFFFFISSMTSPPFPGLYFTSSGGHTEQLIECPFNINSGLELKNISSNVPSYLRLGDLLLQQQVVNLWHYCIFPPFYWNWNLQASQGTWAHALTWQQHQWSRAIFFYCMLFSFPPFKKCVFFFLLAMITVQLFCMTIFEIYEA